MTTFAPTVAPSKPTYVPSAAPTVIAAPSEESKKAGPNLNYLGFLVLLIIPCGFGAYICMIIIFIVVVDA